MDDKLASGLASFALCLLGAIKPGESWVQPSERTTKDRPQAVSCNSVLPCQSCLQSKRGDLKRTLKRLHDHSISHHGANQKTRTKE